MNDVMFLIRRLVREHLGRRLAETNFLDLLRRKRVDPAVYLRVTPPGDLRRHLVNCQRCTQQWDCSAELGTRVSPWDDFSACPNLPVVQRLAAEIRRQKPE